VAQAILDFDDKKYDAALENLRHALQIEPNHVEALYYTGVVYMTQRHVAEAITFLERARARAPSDPAVAFQLALAYVGQQEYNRAKPLLEEVSRVDPTMDGLGYYLGFIRYRDKDYRGALAAFRAGRSSDPEIQQLTRFYSALALGVLGLPSQATAEVDQALRLAPGTRLTGPAKRLRDTLATARTPDRRLSADVRFGIAWDDNVIVRPNENSSEPVVAEIRRHAHQSASELFGFRLDYTWYRTEEWESSVGLSFFGTYVNQLPDYNTLDPLFNLSVIRKMSNCEQLLRRLARRGCGGHASRRSRRAAAGATTRWPRAQGDCMLPRPKRNELTTTRYDAVPGTTGTLATKGSVALGRRRGLTWVSPRESTLPLSFRASAVT